MEAAKATWSDSRLDDLNDRLKGVDIKVTRIETRMEAGFSRLDSRIDDRIGRLDAKIGDGIGRLDDRIDKLNHTLAQGLIALIAIIAVLLSALVAIVAGHVGAF